MFPNPPPPTGLTCAWCKAAGIKEQEPSPTQEAACCYLPANALAMNGAVLSSHKAYDAAESKRKKKSHCTT